MNLRRRRRESLDINLTPLIDVVFLLLIFFMVSTTFDRNAELSIQLPSADAPASETREERIEVAIDAEGRFFVNGNALVNSQPDTLRQALAALLGEAEVPPLVVLADGEAQHQSVVVVMDTARQLGILRLRFTTRAGSD